MVPKKKFLRIWLLSFLCINLYGVVTYQFTITNKTNVASFEADFIAHDGYHALMQRNTVTFDWEPLGETATENFSIRNYESFPLEVTYYVELLDTSKFSLSIRVDRNFPYGQLETWNPNTFETVEPNDSLWVHILLRNLTATFEKYPFSLVLMMNPK